MAHNFHDNNGWLIAGLELHQGFHIFPPAPMKFLKLVLLHPFTMGDKQKPTVLFNGVPSVVHQHEPRFLWPHLGIIPDPLDALTPLHILTGSQKCWLPRGAVEICGESATCCVIGGPVSINADCWDVGRWPSSLILNPGTVQTTPTFSDFLAGAVTLAVDLVLDMLFEGAFKIGGALLLKLGSKVLKPLFKRAKDLVSKGLKAAVRGAGRAGRAFQRGMRAAGKKVMSALKRIKCRVTGHPVDTTSGAVVDSKVDLALPGAIPLFWERHYSSARALQRTSLGRGGWTHSLEQWVERDEEGITLQDEEGRHVYFDALEPGEHTFHRPDRLTLTALADGEFSVYSHETRLTRRFAPAGPEGRALLRSISDAHGNAIALEYTGEKLHRVIDTAGREIRAKVSHGGRIVRLEVWVDGRLDQWVDYTYSKMGELASAADALGQAEHYVYDEDHRMVQVTLKNGVSFYYAYDEETGWCKRTWGDGGLHTAEISPDLERRTTRVSGNDEPRILHWNEDGLVVREETPDGIAIATRAYDGDQYLLAEALGAGEPTRYEHDARGNKVRQIDPAGNITRWEIEDDLPVARVTPDGLVTRYDYNKAGSLTGVTYPSQLHIALSYDERGHLRAVRDGEVLLSSFTVDARHDVIEEIDARGARTRYTHDPMGRPVSRTDALGRTTSVQYDRLGKPVLVERPDGTVTRAEYGPLGGPSRILDALGRTTEVTYGGTGSLESLKQPDGEVWRFRYTGGEKLRRVENPRGETYEFVYDAAGRITRELTFDGRALDYQYTPGGRVARIDYPDGSFRAFSHDPLGHVVEEHTSDSLVRYHRDGTGRLLGAVVEQGGERVETRFARDRLGRVAAETQGDRTLSYGYDARGRRTSRVMPEGATTRYEYDALDALSRVEHAGFELVVQRDTLGRETARGDAGGRFSIRSAHDVMDRVVEQRVDVRPPGGGAPATALERRWHYDPIGRVKQVEDNLWGATSYRHGAVGELLEARRRGRAEVFDYDAAGALKNVLEGLDAGPAQAAAQEPWEIAEGDRLLRTERARYTYDARGRRILKEEGGEGPEAKRTEYVWDARDRLRAARLPSGETVAFTYDAFGRRVRKEILDARGEPRRTVEFLWDGDALAADIDSGRGERCFVHAPGTLVPLLQAERGEVFSYLTDRVGVPKELLDQQGRVVWSAAHSAWGRVTETSVDPGPDRPAVESPFRLLGQYADEETGLCSTRFRYFDAEVGRWCSPDPLGLDGGPSLFGFDGSPVSAVDPFGLTGEDDWEIFYRTMSREHAEELQRNRRLLPTRETFISPTRGFSEDYDGVLVKFKMKPGTTEALENIGVRDVSALTRAEYPDMPAVGKGWTADNAFFKGEGRQINIGLGRGRALEVFNDHIEDFDIGDTGC
ncbi:DUF6531 domain-containing protein [Sorangium sp. So ce131]|uniref:DUF6531 domain-containing protein n=1 Tax=Sorangium sp. So ce131 TaxID=3133282 RepID=UPI003F5F6EB0